MNTQYLSAVPKLDLADFTHGNESQKMQFVHDLGKAYEDIGFVAIRNHGVDNELLKELYKQVQAFFELPLETKLQYDDSDGGGQRGYTGFGKEHAKNSNAGDLKEFWHFGQWVEDGDALKDYYPQNKYVSEIPEFNVVGKDIYRALEATGIQMLRAIALFLNQPENYFDDKVHNGNSILRPIHYPPINAEPNGSIRAGEHEDINLITLLVGASADGLEVLSRQGVYVGVTEVQDHIIVNVGDMLQRLTNDRLRSTTHRVVNPPREQWHLPRYSIPFFMHPRPEVSLACLDSCISENNPRKYDDCTAIEFLHERLREIGLMK
ncbi:MAG: isopenicillin N synthase family dioxygenase [Sphingomonadales bacterium]